MQFVVCPGDDRFIPEGLLGVGNLSIGQWYSKWLGLWYAQRCRDGLFSKPTDWLFECIQSRLDVGNDIIRLRLNESGVCDGYRTSVDGY